MSTGLALQMRLDLAALQKKHGSPPLGSQPPTKTPPPTTELPALLHGIASTDAIDGHRQRFLPGAIKWTTPPRIHYRHDASREVGRCVALNYDTRGRLLITAEVTDPTAAACNGFSVGCSMITKYTIEDAALPTFHAVIHACWLDEISCVPTGANTDCIVLNRWPPFAGAQRYALLQRGVNLIGQIAAVAAAEAVRQRARS